MGTKTISKYIDVEVDVQLSDFDVEDLIEELKCRGLTVLDEDVDYRKSATDVQIKKIYDMYGLNQHEKVDELLRELFYESIGRIA